VQVCQSLAFLIQCCHSKFRNKRGFNGLGQFTWANSLPEPTYEKLDRVLMDSDWEHKFPPVSVRFLPRSEALSDHATILLTTRTPSPQCRHPFKFELGWLHRDGF
jgi:hypothetical protein